MERRGFMPRPDVRSVRLLKDLSLIVAGVTAGVALDQLVRDHNVSGLFLVSSLFFALADGLNRFSSANLFHRQ